MSVRNPLWATVLVSIALVVGCGPTIPNGGIDPDRPKGQCEDFERDVERVYGDRVKAGISSGIGKVGGEYSREVTEKVITKMDDLTQTWVMLKESNCKNCVVRKVIDQHMYVKIDTCLDNWLMQVKTVTNSLESGDPRAIENATKALNKIQDEVAECRNRAAEMESMAGSATGDVASANLAEEKLVESAVNKELGLVEAAERAAGEARAAAERAGNLRLQADAMVEQAEVDVEYARWSDALDKFNQAAQTYGNIGYAVGVARALVGLADVYTERAFYPDASKAFDKAEQIYRETVGEQHALYGVMLNGRAKLKLAGEYNEEGLADARRAFDILVAAHGQEVHPDVAESLALIGDGTANLALYGDAVQIYQAAVSLNSRIYGSQHPKVAAVLKNIGYVYRMQNDYARAMTYAEQALKIIKTTFGYDHPEVVSVLVELGNIFIAQNEIPKARQYLEKALDVAKRVHDPEHPQVGVCLAYIGDTYILENNPEAALANYEASHDVWIKSHGEDNPSLANIRGRIADVYVRQQRYDEAMQIYNATLETLKQTYGGDHPDVAGAISQIAGVYFSQEKYKKARDTWIEAMEMTKRVLGDNNVNVAHYLGAIGHSWYRQKKYDKALRVYEDALVIFRANLPEDHQYVQNCKDWIANTQAEMK